MNPFVISLYNTAIVCFTSFFHFYFFCPEQYTLHMCVTEDNIKRKKETITNLSSPAL